MYGENDQGIIPCNECREGHIVISENSTPSLDLKNGKISEKELILRTEHNYFPGKQYTFNIYLNNKSHKFTGIYKDSYESEIRTISWKEIKESDN